MKQDVSRNFFRIRSFFRHVYMYLLITQKAFFFLNHICVMPKCKLFITKPKITFKTLSKNIKRPIILDYICKDK